MYQNFNAADFEEEHKNQPDLHQSETDSMRNRASNIDGQNKAKANIGQLREQDDAMDREFGIPL